MSRYWVHNGFINFNDDKMSKSVGNFFTIRQLVPYCTGEALRLFLLSTHYRGDVNFDVVASCPSCHHELSADDQQALVCSACGASMTSSQLQGRVRFPNLEEAERRVQYLYQTNRRIAVALQATPAVDGPSLEATFSTPGQVFSPLADFEAALDDDFNTPRAIAALNEVARIANLLCAGREKEVLAQKLKPGVRAHLLGECARLLRTMGQVLGVGEQDPVTFLETQRALRLRLRGVDVATVEALLQERAEKKAAKDFVAADAVRERLRGMDIDVMDTPTGVEWSVI